MSFVTTPTTGCRFSVTWRMRDKMEPLHPTETVVHHLRYWAWCECGRTGPYRTEENLAAEDGADHAFPGWRTLPIMRDRPMGEVTTAAWVRWEDEAIRVYPKGWFEAGGPVRTERMPGATRHAPQTGPGGGYDMYARTTPYRRRRRTTEPAQLSLLDSRGGASWSR